MGTNEIQSNTKISIDITLQIRLRSSTRRSRGSKGDFAPFASPNVIHWVGWLKAFMARVSLDLREPVKALLKTQKSKSSLSFSLRPKGHYLCSTLVKCRPPLVLFPNPLNLAHGQAMLGS